MNELERLKQLASARKLKEREETPEPFEDPYSDMTPDEKSKMIIALMAARERDDYKQTTDNLLSKITALEEQLKVRNKNLYGGKSQKGILPF